MPNTHLPSLPVRDDGPNHSGVNYTVRWSSTGGGKCNVFGIALPVLDHRIVKETNVHTMQSITHLPPHVFPICSDDIIINVPAMAAILKSIVGSNNIVV